MKMTELLTGLTNLLMVLTSIICIYLYKGYKDSFWWKMTYALIAVVSVISAVAHCFIWSDTADLVIWTVIYFFLGAFLCAFTLAWATAGKLPKALSRTLAASSFLLTAGLLLYFKLAQNKFSYLGMILGALPPVVLLFLCSVRSLVKEKNKKAWYTFIGVALSLVFGIILNFIKFKIPIGNVIFDNDTFMHFIVCATMMLCALGSRALMEKTDE